MGVSATQYERLKPAIESVLNYTDSFPWYWYFYGEKCYGFAVVEAVPCNEHDPVPPPGSQLRFHPEKDHMMIGDNGTEMMLMDHIATIERQNGGIICEFIALAHAELVCGSPGYLNDNTNRPHDTN